MPNNRTSSPFGPVLKWGHKAQRDAEQAELTTLAEQYLADEDTPLTFLEQMTIVYLPLVAQKRRRGA